jgi:LCP family protein required for cell wall assembly
MLLGTVLGVAGAAYLLAPIRTNVLILGADRRPAEASAASRSDLMILTTVIPATPYVGMLSIPRDLWVEIPGYGPNRINAAYFLAEANSAGAGPQAAVDTVRTNFGVDVHGYVMLEFAGFVRFVDALGGVDIQLDTATGGYPAGRHHLDGTKALAFARDRQGSDDFFRMERGQVLLRALLERARQPFSWPRWPVAGAALLAATKTNMPVWTWPRLGLALVRAGPDGIVARTISRAMVQGFTTDAGAQVLAPDWTRINPVLFELFGQ